MKHAHFAAALGTALLTQAYAQESEETDEIVVVGLRPAAPATITASVTVLDKGDLALRDAPYLADQLRAVPGAAVSRAGARGGLTQLRLRGSEANHTLFLIDGIEVSDPVTGETDLGLFPSLAAERIEVLRGEQSALYGSDAIGGVVLVQTEKAPSPSLRLEGGSDDTARADLQAGFERGEAEGGLFLSGFTTQGVDSSGGNGEKDGSAAGSAALNGGWTRGEASLSGLLRFARTRVETDADRNFDGLPDDTDNVSKSSQWTAGLNASARSGFVDHLLNLSYNRVVREDEADGAFASETVGERSKIRYSPSVRAGLGAVAVRLSGLADFEREDYSRRAVSAFGDPNQEQRFDTLGLASELSVDGEHFSLTGSLRRDLNDGLFEDATTWRLGAALLPVQGTKFRASVGEGVKNPTFTELFGFFPGQFSGNPDLVPERSLGYEVGLDQRAGPAELSLSYYRAELEDEIVTLFNPDFTTSPDNRAGESERQGVEVAARLDVTETLELSGTYAWLDAEEPDGNAEIRRPEHTGSASLGWRPASVPGARLGLAADYVGEQDDTFFTFPARTVSLSSYVLLSMTASYPLTERLDLTLRGENLLNEEVTDVFGFEGPGAGVFFGIRLRP